MELVAVFVVAAVLVVVFIAIVVVVVTAAPVIYNVSSQRQKLHFHAQFTPIHQGRARQKQFAHRQPYTHTHTLCHTLTATHTHCHTHILQQAQPAAAS